MALADVSGTSARGEQKCALIVDDSRTAREFLRRMLEDQRLRVEMAESAEEALGFLTSQRPDVIFMDHMMPGMDGFQAVKAIKDNPATATIPVMMYTSQSGELYVGQARALGAVGVLPKQIRPVEVREVLRSLHLLPGDQPTTPARRWTDQPAALPGVESVNAPADWSDLHRWLQEMLVDHNRALRADLESTVSRAVGEALATPVPARPGRITLWPAGALIAALAAVAAVFFWLHLDSQARWRAAMLQNQGLLATLDARREEEVQRGPVASVAAPPAPGPAPDLAGLAPVLEWSINQPQGFGPDELPFGDARLAMLTGLLDRLRTLGFRGTVRLEGHSGDFCLVRDPDSGWRLAPDDLPVVRCDRMGLPVDEARAESGRQSVTFANFLASLGKAGGPVRVELEAVGNARPRAAYPPVAEGVTAGDWNRAARENQRVEVRLQPEAGGIP